MTDRTPPSRPALRKSVDAALHPALAGATSQTAASNATRMTGPGPGRDGGKSGKPLGKAHGAEASSGKLAPGKDAAKPGSKAESKAASKPGSKGTAKPVGKPVAKMRRGATSDVLRPSKHDPGTKLTLTIPKALRKQLKTLAKAEGIEPEELAARLIAGSLS